MKVVRRKRKRRKRRETATTELGTIVKLHGCVIPDLHGRLSDYHLVGLNLYDVVFG